MKTIFKTLAIVAAASCVFFGGSAMAANSASKAKAEAATKKAPAKFLFAMDAAHGKLTHIKGREYRLVIPLKDIKLVLAFSDRPNRIAFGMKPDDFVKLTNKGTESFMKDSPNAAIKVGSGAIGAYEIKTASKIRESLELNLKHIGDYPPLEGEGATILFIDDSSAKLETCAAYCGSGWGDPTMSNTCKYMGRAKGLCT